EDGIRDRNVTGIQTCALPISFADISKQLAKTWGTDWSSQFKHFSHKPVATASIAQVHKAQLLTGDWVAVKVLLPDVRKIFNQDQIGRASCRESGYICEGAGYW